MPLIVGPTGVVGVPTANVGRCFVYDRDRWLADAVGRLRPLFAEIGLPLPRLTVESSSTDAEDAGDGALGICWDRTESPEAVPGIVISCGLTDPIDILETLVHEAIHALLDCDGDHGDDFQDAMDLIGLVGPPRHTVAGPELLGHIQAIAEGLGPYPPHDAGVWVFATGRIEA